MKELFWLPWHSRFLISIFSMYNGNNWRLYMEFSTEWMERFKWPISVSQTIETSPQKIWSVISSPGNLEDCHPFCEQNPVHKWPGVGSIDRINYYSGWVMDREFINWIDGVGYDLSIGRKGGGKSYVSWRIKEVQKSISALSITIYPHALQNTPILFRWVPYIGYIQPALSSYLKSVTRGFEWFIKTGKPVRKNQFGSHKWFSN
jgi:hypothetical protein